MKYYERWRNMTPEERAQTRERFRQLPPEERERLRGLWRRATPEERERLREQYRGPRPPQGQERSRSGGSSSPAHAGPAGRLRRARMPPRRPAGAALPGPAGGRTSARPLRIVGVRQ